MHHRNDGAKLDIFTNGILYLHKFIGLTYSRKTNLNESFKVNPADTSTSANYYGYGWDIINYKNRKIVYHNGALPGFRSMFHRRPEERTAIVILVNSEPVNTLSIARGVADAL